MYVHYFHLLTRNDTLWDIDIIALLIISALLLSIFICWQWSLERIHDLQRRNSHKPKMKFLGMKLPPPIMKLSLWGRARGRFAAVMIIAFLSCSAFIGWAFWSQVRLRVRQSHYPLLLTIFQQALPTRLQINLTASSGSQGNYDDGRGIPMQSFYWFHSRSYTDGDPYMWAYFRTFVFLSDLDPITAIGMAGATIGCVLMATIKPYATYWAFVFPSMVVSVLGSELIYTAGTLYIAKITPPDEQSLAAGIFQTMVQVRNSQYHLIEDSLTSKTLCS
jgi:hypothetical protein